MKKLQKKLTAAPSPTLVHQHPASSPSYIQSLESRRIAKQHYESKINQFDFDQSRRFSSSLQFLAKDKLLKFRSFNNNSSLSSISNISYSLENKHLNRENHSGLSYLSNESPNEKSELAIQKRDQNIRTPFSQKGALAIIHEKKNKIGAHKTISAKYLNNDQYYNLDSLELDEKLKIRKISLSISNAESVMAGSKQTTPMAITASSQNDPSSSEDHFKKHFKYMHRNKNLVKLKDFVENRDEISKTPSQKAPDDELYDESINFLADVKEKRFRNVKGQRFKKWARLMKCISKVLIVYKKKQELNFLFVQKFTVCQCYFDRINSSFYVHCVIPFVSKFFFGRNIHGPVHKTNYLLCLFD